MRVLNVEADVQEVVVANGADEETRRIKRQRVRSIAIALGLAFLVILFYIATIVRMGNQGP